MARALQPSATMPRPSKRRGFPRSTPQVGPRAQPCRRAPLATITSGRTAGVGGSNGWIWWLWWMVSAALFIECQLQQDGIYSDISYALTRNRSTRSTTSTNPKEEGARQRDTSSRDRAFTRAHIRQP